MRYLAFIILLVAVHLTGCSSSTSNPDIILSELEPLPENSLSEVEPLRVAIAAIISPRGTADSYGLLLDYLGSALNRPVEMVQRRTYAEVNDLVKSGDVDLAFVCTSAYVLGKNDFEMQLLVAPQVEGSISYHSLLIVSADSPAESMADLRNTVFAFTDPMSTTGRSYPVSLVQQLGFAPEDFFKRTFYAYSHDDAIRAVADRVAGGAAVDSIVYAYATAREPSLGETTKVIHKSPGFGIPPVVVSPHTRPQLREELRSVLLEMSNSPAGLSALEAAGFERFVSVDDSAYDSVRELQSTVALQPGYDEATSQ